MVGSQLYLGCKWKVLNWEWKPKGATHSTDNTISAATTTTIIIVEMRLLVNIAQRTGREMFVVDKIAYRCVWIHKRYTTAHLSFRFVAISRCLSMSNVFYSPFSPFHPFHILKFVFTCDGMKCQANAFWNYTKINHLKWARNVYCRTTLYVPQTIIQQLHSKFLEKLTMQWHKHWHSSVTTPSNTNVKHNWFHQFGFIARVLCVCTCHRTFRQNRKLHENLSYYEPH